MLERDPRQEVRKEMGFVEENSERYLIVGSRRPIKDLKTLEGFR